MKSDKCMEQAVVCVSFGTSVPAGRENITAVENALRQSARDRVFVSALTSPTIRRILRERGEAVYSVSEALERVCGARASPKSWCSPLTSFAGMNMTS